MQLPLKSAKHTGIAELTRLLANLGVSIKDMLHERAWIKNDIFSVEVRDRALSKRTKNAKIWKRR